MCMCETLHVCMCVCVFPQHIICSHIVSQRHSPEIMDFLFRWLKTTIPKYSEMHCDCVVAILEDVLVRMG
jgi:hypothetical protein